jgi:drug/metabolite transporter (DMT)-like permease
VLAVALLHERLTWMQMAGAVVAITAAILLSLEPAPVEAEA